MSQILIIGGNHGLGLEWVKYYLAQGDEVVATYRNEDASEGLFSIDSNNLSTIKCDVTEPNDVAALNNIKDKIDTIIYNAGTKGYSKPFIKPEENTTEELMQALLVNTVGLNAVIKTLFDKILDTPHCKFVYMSTGVSHTSDNGSGGYHPYRISKNAGNTCIRNFDIRAAELHLAKNLAVNTRPLFFALTPGLVDIGMGKGVQGATPPQEAIQNMAKVMRHVEETNDTHGLWSHTGKKLESYTIPNVITAQQQPIVNQYKLRTNRAIGYDKNGNAILANHEVSNSPSTKKSMKHS